MQHRSPERLPIALYYACKQCDIALVRHYLVSMNMEDINYQMSSNGNTALHEATSSGNAEIVKLLLEFYAVRSIKNADGQIPYDLAKTEEIRQLFHRPQSHSRFITKLPSELNMYCKSCSLVDDQSSYEWELIEPNASQKAFLFRRKLKPSTTKRLVTNRIYTIISGYLRERIAHLSLVECILDLFKRAGKEDNPVYIVEAYTTSQNFSKILNSDMTRNVIHDIRNGCSKFCCDYLYSTEDGTKSIATILLYHPQFQSLSFVGTVYRGLVIKQSIFSHYVEGSCIITTTFLSTSKYRTVAERFNGQDNSLREDDISVLCTYTIKSENRTALYIAEYSQFPPEAEVLILPYSPFRITKRKTVMINDQHPLTEIYLEQCDAPASSVAITTEEEQR